MALMDTGSWKSWELQQEPKNFTLLARPKVNASLLHGFPPPGFIYGLGCSAVKWLELLASGGHNYPSKLTPIEMNGAHPFLRVLLLQSAWLRTQRTEFTLVCNQKGWKVPLPLSCSLFLNRKSLLFADLWGGEHGGMVKPYNLGLEVLSTYEVAWLWRAGKGWSALGTELPGSRRQQRKAAVLSFPHI